MRIAVWYDLLAGGGKRALYDHVRGLVARGHEIESWCSPTTEQDYLPLSSIVQEHVIPHRLKLPTKTFLRRFHPLQWNAPARLRAMNEHCRKCAEQINAGGFDLLFSGPSVFFSMPSIARYVDIPSVMYLQEPLRMLYESDPDLPWAAPQWTLRRCFDPQFCRTALARRIKLPGMRVQVREERNSALAFDEILVNSFFSRESVMRAYGIDSKVCYLGVDTDKFVCMNRTREQLAVCVGALVPRKNAEGLVIALSKVPQNIRPRFVWIGETVYADYLKRVQSLAEATGVSFELKHRISDTELIEILNRARVMLYAPRLEPFGYAPLEANACGVPVIAVAEGGMRETIEDGVNGILVENGPENIASAVRRLMTDHVLAARFSRDAACLARKKWSLSASIDRLEERLKSTLARMRRTE